MPARLIDLHPEALAEARETYLWYRERSLGAAELFTAELDRAIESISEAPRRWPAYLLGTRRFLLHRFPYAVIYRERRERIQVVAVAHGRRRPDYWKAR
jgi:plasmid stabilization system protein ParE